MQPLVSTAALNTAQLGHGRTASRRTRPTNASTLAPLSRLPGYEVYGKQQCHKAQHSFEGEHV